MGEQMHDDLAEYQAQLAERDAEIAALRQQVAELQAWKDAVPVDAIERYFRNVSEVEEYAESRQDFAAILSYLFPAVR